MKFKSFYKYIFVFLVSLFVLIGCGPSSTNFVSDTTKPVITLKGASSIELTKGTAYTELGATATDDRDGNVSVTISGTIDVNVIGSYTITYKAKDGAGNEAMLRRIVKVVLAPDTIAPVITLSGDSRIDIVRGTTFTDPGAISVDAIDGNITVTSSGVVETTTIGEYTITYTATDNAGNTSTLTRVINVYVPTSKITGYAEDDPMPNAEVKVTDKDNNIIAQATADANGKYSLEGEFEDGKVYTLESKGKIADKNVTLHSIFKFSNDTVINANPITELKYQLVQSGKSIDEAESLIRDYFSVVSGEKLERNRFDIEGSLALGMIDLAKLYDGILPIDAIEKIKEDILRNADLAIEDREYAYKDSLQLNLELTASSSSLKVGDSVTVTLTGADELNSNYSIEWVAIPNDDNQSTLSKTFTIDEPRDVIVGVNLYIKDDTNSSNNILLKSVSTKVNFYKVEEPVSIDINGTDANVSVASDVKLNIPASASGSVSEIKYSEVTTNSNDYLKVFTLEPSGTVFSEPMEIRIKYDPSQVYDPRLLTIKRVSDDGKEEILKVKEVDYANNELIFETEHFSKFWVERHITYHKYNSVVYYPLSSRTSFDVWNDITENTPFDFLKEAMEYYCRANNILQICQSYQYTNYFSYELAKANLSDTYKEILSSNNYDVFINDYYLWKYIKILEKGNFIEYWKSGEDDKGKAIVIGDITFKKMVKYLFSAKLDGKRAYNIGYYLNSSYSNHMSYEFKGRTKELDMVKKISKRILRQLYGASSNTILLPIKIYTKFLKLNTNILINYQTGRGALGKTELDQRISVIFFDTDTVSAKKYSLDMNGRLLFDSQYFSEEKVLDIVSNIYPIHYANEYFDTHEKRYNFLSLFYEVHKITDFLVKNEEERQKFKENILDKTSKLSVQIISSNSSFSLKVLEYKRQGKLKVEEVLLKNRKNKLKKRSFQKSETAGNEIVTIPVLDNFDNFLEQIKINIPESKWDSIEVKKVSLSVDKYAIESEASTSTTIMTFNMTNFVGNSYFSKQNIAKDGFTLANEKYSQSLASIFTDLDGSDFQDSFVVVKAKILIKLNGVDRVVSKEYQFINYLDSDNELITEPEYGKLTSAIKDAVTGNPIVDARITLLPIDITNNTDENGNYSFSKLPPNTYNVRVSKEGYKTETIYGVTLEDGEVKNIEILLAIDEEYASSLGGADITLKDALNGNVITNGYIKVREGQNNKTGELLKELTNSGNSAIHIDMNASTYTVEVGANGYSKSFNTVTIIGDTNNTYEFSITPILAEDQVRVVLTWGENPNDLDSHLVRLSDNDVDYHVYYSNMSPANADANLDTDDTSSYGPETITISGLSNASTYRYYVHDYSNGSNHNDEIFKASGAKVEVYYGDQSKTFYVPNENGNAWKVFEIVNGEIVPCTTGCIFGVDGDSDANIGLRKLDRNSLDKRYFRNLPAK